MNSRTSKTQQSRRELFFNNLMFLGLELEYTKKKYNVVLNRDMFALPNKKAFEVVSHFLFSKLSPLATEDYSIVWPLYEKRQEHEFRKTCFNHLVKISKDETCMVRFPRIVQIMFLSPGGDRFCELYLAFSAYVMVKVVQKYEVCTPLYRPRLSSTNNKVVKNVLQASMCKAIKNFVSVLEKTKFYEEKWQIAADDMVKYHRQTNQTIHEKQKLLKELLPTLYSLYPEVQGMKGESEIFPVVYEEGVRKVTEVESLFKEVYYLMKKEKSLWDIVSMVLESQKLEKFILDGKSLNVPVPEVLRRECQKELEEMEGRSLFQNGKLSLSSFFKLGHVSLQHYKRVVVKAEIHKHSDLEQELTENLQMLHKCSKSAKDSRQSLMTDTLPKLTNEYQALQPTVYFKFKNEKFMTKDSFRTMPTPTLQFSPCQHTISQSSKYTFTPPSDPTQFLKRKYQRRSKEYRGLDNFAENQGHLKPSIHFHQRDLDISSQICSSDSRSSMINIKKCAKNSTSSECVERDQNVRTCIDELESFLQQSVEQPKKANDLFDSSSCFSPVTNNYGKNLNEVASKFVQQFSKCASERESCDSVSVEPNLPLQYLSIDVESLMGEKAFDTTEKITRSPPLNFGVNSSPLLARLSLLCNSEDDFFNANCPKSRNKQRDSYQGHDWSEHIALDALPDL